MDTSRVFRDVWNETLFLRNLVSKQLEASSGTTIRSFFAQTASEVGGESWPQLPGEVCSGQWEWSKEGQVGGALLVRSGLKTLLIWKLPLALAFCMSDFKKSRTADEIFLLRSQNKNSLWKIRCGVYRLLRGS